MTQVSRLKIVESVAIKPEMMGIFRASIADGDAHDSIERIVVEIAECMGEIERGLVDLDFARLENAARSLGETSDMLGLLELARVSKNVVNCAARQDIPALYAVTERLIRVGDASLSATIDGATPP